jgi:hypothetical protein
MERLIFSQIADILTFINRSVGDGSLAGSGPGNSGPGRLNALKNMIKAAGDLIYDGFFTEACDQLRDGYQRTDGVPKPRLRGLRARRRHHGTRED